MVDTIWLPRLRLREAAPESGQGKTGLLSAPAAPNTRAEVPLANTSPPQHRGTDPARGALSAWVAPPHNLTLTVGEVHIWRVFLDQCAPGIQDLYQTLTPAERVSVELFYFDADRQRAILRRGILRQILGRYLSLPPHRLQFHRTEYGKPFLTANSGGQWLRFNLSHAGNLALYAITRHRAVGVDVAHMRPEFLEGLPEQLFSLTEVSQLRSLPPLAQVQAFFRCWTRKEAFIKARGDGLALPLDQFDVSLRPGEPARVVATRWDPAEAAKWSLAEVEPGPEYAGAVCLRGSLLQLRCWQWAG